MSAGKGRIMASSELKNRSNFLWTLASETDRAVLMCIDREEFEYRVRKGEKFCSSRIRVYIFCFSKAHFGSVGRRSSFPVVITVVSASPEAPMSYRKTWRPHKMRASLSALPQISESQIRTVPHRAASSWQTSV
jgi:hypothetical protein